MRFKIGAALGLAAIAMAAGALPASAAGLNGRHLGLSHRAATSDGSGVACPVGTTLVDLGNGNFACQSTGTSPTPAPGGIR